MSEYGLESVREERRERKEDRRRIEKGGWEECELGREVNERAGGVSEYELETVKEGERERR